MSRLLPVILFPLVLAGCSRSSQPLAPDAVPLSSNPESRSSVQNESIPLTLILWVSCAAGGAGELVQLEGPLHIVSHVTIDAAGGYHVAQHFQPQGVSGRGTVTGDKYNATGVTRWNFRGKAGYTETYVNNFRIIGRGTDNNFVVHETFHVTIDANGRVTTRIDHYRADCK